VKIELLQSIQAPIQFQKSMYVVLARNCVIHVKVTFSQVYLGELFVKVHVGVSSWQVESHQSQLLMFQSSHCSQISIIQFQHKLEPVSSTFIVHVFWQYISQKNGLNHVNVTEYIHVFDNTIGKL